MIGVTMDLSAFSSLLEQLGFVRTGETTFQRGHDYVRIDGDRACGWTDYGTETGPIDLVREDDEGDGRQTFSLADFAELLKRAPI